MQSVLLGAPSKVTTVSAANKQDESIAPGSESPITFLQDLPTDCQVLVLSHIEGSPPVQAAALVRAANCCHEWKSLAESAAAIIVYSHMESAERELIELRKQHAELHVLNLPGPTFHRGSALQALWGKLPLLPLQWNLLRNSVTEIPDDFSSASQVSMWNELNMHAARVKGGLRISWPVGDPLRATAESYVRGVPLKNLTGFLIAKGLGIDGHPGLLARSRVASRRAAVCPSCMRYRRHVYDEHRAWDPDETDRVLCVLPDYLERKRAEHFAELITRTSSRDAEEFDRQTFVALAKAHALSTALKCACDGGGDLHRCIGVPSRVAERIEDGLDDL